MTPIHYWRYTLRSRRGLNAASNRTGHEGALIRVGDGYGCLHPWPELGDAGLEKQLAYLASGDVAATPLIVSALHCAEVDGLARQAGESLYRREIPESHWLVQPEDDPDEAWARGFNSAKIKGSPDFEGTRRLVEKWTGREFRIRLDFNETPGKGAFVQFWNLLSVEQRAAIEFVEDPETWSEEGWISLRDAGVPIAADRDAWQRWRLGDVYVVKPAYFTGFPNEKARFTVTSYMDHALGQMFAAWKASLCAPSGRFLDCGLLTHRCFEPDEFFERIRCDGPRLLPVEGTGLGFDDQLESLPWKRLN